MDILVNKVAESGIITLNLEDFLPKQEIVELDISDFLFRKLILKEKEFRQHLKDLDISPFHQKIATVFCSTDAIIPQWAYMLATSTLLPATGKIYFGTKEQTSAEILLENIRNIDTEKYKQERVVIKGCGTIPIPDSAYLEVAKKLIPVVKSLMFGEPCSTVPVYKNKQL